MCLLGTLSLVEYFKRVLRYFKNRPIVLASVLVGVFIGVLFLFYIYSFTVHRGRTESLYIKFSGTAGIVEGTGSSHWFTTWHPSGYYAAWYNGRGWDNEGDECVFGITRFTITAFDLDGQDVYCEPLDSDHIKPQALYSIGPVLYLFYCRPEHATANCSNQTLVKRSGDNGLSFSPGAGVSGPGTPYSDVHMAGVVHFGPGNTELPEELDEDYMYALFVKSDSVDSPLYLARGDRVEIVQETGWSWFDGVSDWVQFSEGQPIVPNIQGVGLNSVNIAYNKILKKYFLSYFTGTGGALHVLTADVIRGPYTEIYAGNMGVDDVKKFNGQIFPGIFSEDGKNFGFIFSGEGIWDRIGLIQATLTDHTPSPSSPSITFYCGGSQSCVPSTTVQPSVSIPTMTGILTPTQTAIPTAVTPAPTIISSPTVFIPTVIPTAIPTAVTPTETATPTPPITPAISLIPVTPTVFLNVTVTTAVPQPSSTPTPPVDDQRNIVIVLLDIIRRLLDIIFSRLKV